MDACEAASALQKNPRVRKSRNPTLPGPIRPPEGGTPNSKIAVSPLFSRNFQKNFQNPIFGGANGRKSCSK